MKVLLADDESDIRTLYRQMLEGCGYQVAEAEDGREVLSLIESDRYDLVVMDLHMPNVDGFEALSRLRAKDRGVPVILMTGYYPDEVVKERLEGMAVCTLLRKPVMITALLSAVKAIAREAA